MAQTTPDAPWPLPHSKKDLEQMEVEALAEKKEIDAFRRRSEALAYSKNDIRGAVSTVKTTFDPVVARRLIEYFYTCFEERLPFDQFDLNDYIHHVFGRIIEGENPAVALGLELPQGRPSLDPRRDMGLAAEVVRGMRRGMKWLDAVEATAGRFFPDGTGDGAVKRAYGMYKVALKDGSDEDLAEIANWATPNKDAGFD